MHGNSCLGAGRGYSLMKHDSPELGSQGNTLISFLSLTSCPRRDLPLGSLSDPHSCPPGPLSFVFYSSFTHFPSHLVNWPSLPTWGLFCPLYLLFLILPTQAHLWATQSSAQSWTSQACPLGALASQLSCTWKMIVGLLLECSAEAKSSSNWNLAVFNVCGSQCWWWGWASFSSLHACPSGHRQTLTYPERQAEVLQEWLGTWTSSCLPASRYWTSKIL